MFDTVADDAPWSRLVAATPSVASTGRSKIYGQRAEKTADAGHPLDGQMDRAHRQVALGESRAGAAVPDVVSEGPKVIE